MIKSINSIIACLITAFVILSSSFAKNVKRGGDENLTPYLNESDCRAICKDMVGQIIQNPRISKFED